VTNQEFTRRNIRIADNSGTIRIQLFGNKVDLVKINKKYVFHQLRKRIYNGRHQLEIFGKSSVEEVPINDLEVLNEDLSEDEELRAVASDLISGMITGKLQTCCKFKIIL
jgi:CHAD domain-containing protein